MTGLLSEPADAVPGTVREGWLRSAGEVRERLRTTAAERDRAGRPPVEEVGWLRDAGLLPIFIPTEFGGGGATYSDVAAVVQQIAAGDSSTAHILLYHYFGSIAGTRGENGFAGPNRARRIARDRLFHGTVAQAAYEPLVEARPSGPGFLLNGSKPFTSGAAVGDVLLVWARFASGTEIGGQDVSGQIATVHVEANAPGVGFGDDWDNIGQRLTVSGTTTLTDVAVGQEAVIGYGYGSAPATAADHLDVLYMYAGFAAILTGIAWGAFEEAAGYTRTRSRPWVESTYDRAARDPLVLERFGGLWASLQSADALTQRATSAVDAVRLRGSELSWAERADAVTLVNAARLHASEVAITLSSRVFEVTGARSSSAAHGLDRFWRNARTLSLHDPLYYKQVQLGDYVLNGTEPVPGFYS